MPRETMPPALVITELRIAPMLFTSVAGKPLYIRPPWNTWHSASRCETDIPWNATPT